MIRGTWVCAVALIIVAVLSPALVGQPGNDKKKKRIDDIPPGAKGKGGFAVKGVPAALTYWAPATQLAGIDEVVRDLKLDAKQQDKLVKAAKDFQDANAANAVGPIADRLKKQQEAAQKFEETVKTTLGDKTKRLEQIAAQGAGLQAFFTPARRQQLELTDEQVAKGREIIDAVYKEMIGKDVPKLTAAAARSPQNRTRFVEKSTIKLLELLTKDQNKRWLDIVGDPLQPEVLLKVRTGTSSPFGGIGGFGPANPPGFGPGGKGAPGGGKGMGPGGSPAARLAAIQRALTAGSYAEAETLARQALDLAKEPTLQRGDYLVALGSALTKLGRAGDAETAAKDALAIFEKQLGPYHPRIAAAITVLGEAADVAGQFDVAAKHQRKALDLNEKVAGASSVEAAANWNALGLIALRQRKLDEAETCLRKSLDIKEKTLGKNHTSVAQSAYNLGQLYRDMRKLKEAEEHGMRALGIFTQMDHADAVLPMSLLSAIYVEQKRWDEAEKHTRAWLQVTDKGVRNSAASLAPLDRLATILTAMGRAEEAAAIDLRRKSVRDKLAAEKKPAP
ncbi:MAG: tetratricopeptide repeat protein [Planctomycetes bacterium]|nr:tetratricopeptide repeat protein [Planctomycetota bacterium]